MGGAAVITLGRIETKVRLRVVFAGAATMYELVAHVLISGLEEGIGQFRRVIRISPSGD